MADIKCLQDWVTHEMVRGRYIFTKEDVLNLHLPISDQALQNSLTRLTDRGIIMSPWQNFYVIIPNEYKLRGVVPPSFYIDKLMSFLKRDYYVSLLTAAAMNGASHQRAMVFQATVNGGPIRSGMKNGVRVQFTLRQNLPLEFTRRVKTLTGYMTVAEPELTALDVVAEELINNPPTGFVHYGCQTLLPSPHQIPPRDRYSRRAHLPARWLAPLLAGLAADGHPVCADVRGRTIIDGEESGSTA